LIRGGEFFALRGSRARSGPVRSSRAADVEQDGAPPFLTSSSGEQPITASVASVSRSITIEPDAGLAATRSRKLSALARAAASVRSAAGGGLAEADLVAEMRGGDGAVDAASLMETGGGKCLRRDGRSENESTTRKL
jgi:hypothetical protein